MANLFDAANAPTTEPLEIVVGDFIQWKRTDLGTDYPNNLFTATYIARITGGGTDSPYRTRCTTDTTRVSSHAIHDPRL